MPAAAKTAAAPPPLRRLFATRYVTALREGGSVPAVVEADDGALYVAKFRAAAQGGRVLAAELIVGELARAAGLRVPELALIDIDAALGRSEPHQEIQELLIASAGTNLAMAYLAGAVGYDVAARRPVERRAGVGDRGAGRVRGQRRSHRAQPEPAVARRRAVAHRSRRVAVSGTTAGTASRRRASSRRRRRARSRAPANTCCCRSPTGSARGGRGAGGGAGRRRRSTAPSRRCPTRGWTGRAAPSCARAYAVWLRARRAALPRIIEEATRVRAARV